MENDGWPGLLEDLIPGNKIPGNKLSTNSCIITSWEQLILNSGGSSVLKSLEWLSSTLPHYLSPPEGEKLETQVLRGLEALTWSKVRLL